MKRVCDFQCLLRYCPDR